MYDHTIKHKSKSLLNYNNPNYWKELVSLGRDAAYKKHKRKLKEFTETFSLNIQKQIAEIIQNKTISLYQKGIRIDRFTKDNKERKEVQIEKDKGITIDTLYIVSKEIPPERKCLITGLDISMQRKDSVLMSHTGLKHYHANKPETYQRLKQKYLSVKWANVDFKTEIKELAHSIRNVKNNNLIRYECHFIGMNSLF